MSDCSTDAAKSKHKTFTDSLVKKLNAECLRQSRHGACNMECDVYGSKMGWCKAVWGEVNGGSE